MKNKISRQFGKYLIENKLATKNISRPGISIWISEHGQSYERKRKHAAAMAEVLRKYGISNVYADSRLD